MAALPTAIQASGAIHGVAFQRTAICNAWDHRTTAVSVTPTMVAYAIAAVNVVVICGISMAAARLLARAHKHLSVAMGDSLSNAASVVGPARAAMANAAIKIVIVRCVTVPTAIIESVARNLEPVARAQMVDPSIVARAIAAVMVVIVGSGAVTAAMSGLSEICYAVFVHIQRIDLASLLEPVAKIAVVVGRPTATVVGSRRRARMIVVNVVHPTRGRSWAGIASAIATVKIIRVCGGAVTAAIRGCRARDPCNVAGSTPPTILACARAAQSIVGARRGAMSAAVGSRAARNPRVGAIETIEILVTVVARARAAVDIVHISCRAMAAAIVCVGQISIWVGTWVLARDLSPGALPTEAVDPSTSFILSLCSASAIASIVVVVV